MSSILFSTSELNQFLSSYIVLSTNTSDIEHAYLVHAIKKIHIIWIKNYLYHIDKNYCLLTVLSILNAYTTWNTNKHDIYMPMIYTSNSGGKD